VCSDAIRPTALLHHARTRTAQSTDGSSTACLDKCCNVPWTLQEAYTVCAGYESQRDRARPLRWAPPPSRARMQAIACGRFRRWPSSCAAGRP
jgi:hypothetical protein